MRINAQGAIGVVIHDQIEYSGKRHTKNTCWKNMARTETIGRPKISITAPHAQRDGIQLQERSLGNKAQSTNMMRVMDAYNVRRVHTLDLWKPMSTNTTLGNMEDTKGILDI